MPAVDAETVEKARTRGKKEGESQGPSGDPIRGRLGAPRVRCVACSRVWDLQSQIRISFPRRFHYRRGSPRLLLSRSHFGCHQRSSRMMWSKGLRVLAGDVVGGGDLQIFDLGEISDLDVTVAMALAAVEVIDEVVAVVVGGDDGEGG